MNYRPRSCPGWGSVACPRSDRAITARGRRTTRATSLLVIGRMDQPSIHHLHLRLTIGR